MPHVFAHCHKSVRNQDESCVLCTEEDIGGTESCVLCTEEDIGGTESPGPLLEQIPKILKNFFLDHLENTFDRNILFFILKLLK